MTQPQKVGWGIVAGVLVAAWVGAHFYHGRARVAVAEMWSVTQVRGSDNRVEQIRKGDMILLLDPNGEGHIEVKRVINGRATDSVASFRWRVEGGKLRITSNPNDVDMSSLDGATVELSSPNWSLWPVWQYRSLKLKWPDGLEYRCVPMMSS